MVNGINSIIVAGAGVMGTSIAQLFARCGYKVDMYEVFAPGIEKSKELIAVNQKASMEAGDLTEEQVAQIRANISYTSDKEVFRNAQYVIECITEKMEVKHSFWAEVSAIAPETAILTTNTSGLSITKIAEAVVKPERFAGMHWLNPPHICPLIEIIKGEKSADETCDIIYEVAEDIGRKPVRLNKEVPGFLINRFQFSILREAMDLIDAGICTTEDIDRVFKYGLGVRYAALGPFEIADLGGLDTFNSIASYLFADLSKRDNNEDTMLREIVNEGGYGVKNGKGFYDYSDGKDKEAIAKRDRDYLKVAKALGYI